VNVELTPPQEDERTDALDVAGALEEDAAARLETAAVIAEAADEAEAEAIAEGSYAEAGGSGRADVRLLRSGRIVTDPLMVNLRALLRRFSRICFTFWSLEIGFEIA
jgi:hypothetical protein